MTGPKRYCPLCEQRLDQTICPVDNVPTVDASVLDKEEKEVLPGTVVAGRYKIEKLLGKGAMGSVFLARQVSMDSYVALKILQPGLMQDAKQIRRFWQEARAASRLNHPNIVRVFDFGIDPELGLPFIGMEFIQGTSLKKLVKAEGPFPEKKTALIMSQVCKALVEAHEKGIVHRDLKPDNILIRVLPDGDYHCTVLDFGIAKLVSSEEEGFQDLTQAGVMLGTPAYMSPEQIMGEPVDFRSDLYSLGCVLHFVLTGTPPYSGQDKMALLLRHTRDPVPPLPDTLSDGQPPSADISTLHKALLAKRRIDRPSSTSIVAKIFTSIAKGEHCNAWNMLDMARKEAGQTAQKQTETKTEGQDKASSSLPSIDSLPPPPPMETSPEIKIPKLKQPKPAIDVSPETKPYYEEVPLLEEPVKKTGLGKIGIVAFFIVAVTVGIFFLWYARQEKGEEANTVVLTDILSSTHDSVISPDPSIVASITHDLATSPKTEVKKITLLSEPEGGDIYFGDKKIGTTPYQFEVKENDKEALYVIRKKRFAESYISISYNSPPEVVVKLKPLPKIDSTPSPPPKQKTEEPPKIKVW